MNRNPDKEYTKLFKRLGDPSLTDAALRDIYVLCRGEFIRYIKTFIPHDEESVKDLFDDLMVILCERAQDVASKANPKYWMFGIVRNLVREYLRRTRRMPTERIDAYLDLVDGQLADGELELAELEQLILDATHEMTPKRREVFLFRWQEGLTKAEIAERNGTSPHTVKKQLADAIQQVGEVLKNKLGFK